MTASRRLCSYSRQVTDLLREARALAAVPVAERETDDYRARLATFETRRAELVAGPAEPDRTRYS